MTSTKNDIVSLAAFLALTAMLTVTGLLVTSCHLSPVPVVPVDAGDAGPCGPSSVDCQNGFCCPLGYACNNVDGGAASCSLVH